MQIHTTGPSRPELGLRNEKNSRPNPNLHDPAPMTVSELSVVRTSSYNNVDKNPGGLASLVQYHFCVLKIDIGH